MRRVLTLALAVGAALLLGAAPAWAHSQLDASNPANGASVATPPSSVSLTFNEDVQPGFTVITLIGPDGKDYHSGDVTETDQTVKVDALPLGPAGQYQIGYRVVSADGHPVSGKTTFTLTTAGPGSPDAKVPDGERGAERGAVGRASGRRGRAGVAVDRGGGRARGRGRRPGAAAGPRVVSAPVVRAAGRVAPPRARAAGRARSTDRGGSPDSPRRNARLTAAKRPTHRGETPDSPCRITRLTAAKRPTHRAGSPDSPRRNARLTAAKRLDSPCPGIAGLTVAETPDSPW